ncbi:MAG TPA: NADH-quinone oxidoreductase subunit M [Acidimicrobiales bacterium]|nr:NADH-quinone oxidoreductase subunit M [Acidimicrobiales bacterium]
MFAAEGAPVSFPLLTALVVTPALGALLLGLIPRGRVELHRMAALLSSCAAGALAIYALADFETGAPGFQYEVNTSWVSELGISWHLGLDGISLFLVVLTGILFPIAIVAVTPEHDSKPYYAWLLVLQAGCMGVFTALDLFLFFVMFEIVLVPMYFLIGGWGHGRRVYAALKFFLFTMFGSALMLVGILALVFLHQGAAEDRDAELADQLQQQIELEVGQGTQFTDAEIAELTGTLDELRQPAQLTFDLVTIAESQFVPDNDAGANPFDWTAARWIFLAFALAFSVKVPLFPLHTWLPDAHTEAPTAGSVILAGVMLKLGTYGFIRYGLYLFPGASLFFGPTFVTLGVIGIIYGAIAATMQKDLKRLVAYSSVAHLGFIAMGTFSITTQGIQGSIFQMVAHGISTGALFLLVGMIYERRHTREISALKGLQKVAPVMAGVFTLVMLSSVGLPGLNGFVGEFLILIGSFLTYRWWAVVAAVGVILAALYLLWAYQRVFHGEPDEANADMPDMHGRELLALSPLLVLIVFMGIYPKPMLERMAPAVDSLIAHVEVNTDYVQPEISVTGFGEPEATGEGTDVPAEGEGE